MSISFGLGANIKLGTSQKLTPQMQQAIRLLQMSSLELEQEVQLQLDKNPMLEREDSSQDALDNAQSISDIDPQIHDNLEGLNHFNHSASDGSKSQDSSLNHEGSEPLENNAFDKLSDNYFDDSAMDTNWDSVYTSAPSSLSGGSDEDLMSYQGSTSSTIQDHIRWQINFKNLSEIDTVIADYLIDSMDDSGFIRLAVDELHSNLATFATFYQWEEVIEQNEILAVLKVIQSCEPLGIGARNLSECLHIQLSKKPENTPYLREAKTLIDYCHYLQSNNISALITETGLKVEDIEPALMLIRTLNPAPGQTFIDSQPSNHLEPESYDIPDVLVHRYNAQQDSDKHSDADSADSNDKNEATDNEVIWDVRLNPETLPKLKINQEYACLVKRGDNSADNTYLKENLTEAKLFLRSIEERNQNLLKVAICIVKKQEQFLLHGTTAMQPLILKEVATEVELHESTISRLTTSKSILTPQGLFSLKYFFSSSVSGSDGDVSSTAICAMIETLIAHENPKKPLSDNAIVKHLNKRGIEIARRTVAKYREQLNIGSSTQRKQRY